MSCDVNYCLAYKRCGSRLCLKHRAEYLNIKNTIMKEKSTAEKMYNIASFSIICKESSAKQKRDTTYRKALEIIDKYAQKGEMHINVGTLNNELGEGNNIPKLREDLKNIGKFAVTIDNVQWEQFDNDGV